VCLRAAPSKGTSVGPARAAELTRPFVQPMQRVERVHVQARRCWFESSCLVLRGRFANPQFQDLLDCLTSHQGRNAHRRRQQPRGGNPDGRRKFGTVSSAIVKVFSESGTEMPVKAITAEGETQLGGTVSRFSVSDYLRTRSKGARPLFERTRWGHYRLLSKDDASSPQVAA